MRLIYQGSGENIPHVPAHDLDEATIQTLADNAGVSVDAYIAMLTKRGLYTAEKPKRKTKQDEAPPENEASIETAEEVDNG